MQCDFSDESLKQEGKKDTGDTDWKIIQFEYKEQTSINNGELVFIC